MSAPAATEATPVVTEPAAPVTAEPAAATAAAAAAAAAPAASPAAAAAATSPAPLSAQDKLTLMMIEKSISTLSSHAAIASRGVSMLLRNLYGILFGPMFSQSWENQMAREEQKSGKNSFQRTNDASLKRMAHFFTSKKVRAKSGSALALALLNPSSARESFEHRLTLLWLGGRMYKIDGMKRDGLPGLTKEQSSWPVAITEVPEQGKALWAALQVLIHPSNPRAEWTKEKQAAFDTLIEQHGPNTRSVPLAHRIELKGPQTFVCLTNDEEGLMVDLANGLAQRLKAISMQLEAMPQ